MRIAINAVAAFKEKRTGVEEYSYQLIKHFAKIDFKNQFILYIQKGQNFFLDFNLPDNFMIKSLAAPFMWSQTRLFFEMIKSRPDALFIPAQVSPFFYTKNSIVTVHGLEYEYFPECYSYQFKKYIRFFTKYALKKAKKIIAVSNNTKKDLITLYGGDSDKIQVVHHGFKIPDTVGIKQLPKIQIKDQKIENYVLYIGRIETKKNLINLVKAFEIFKQKSNSMCKLVLIGGKGYGWQKIYKAISQSSYKNDIMLTGFISNDLKVSFLQCAELFVFTSFYEGFGMPILEAMSFGIPVIASNCSSIPEICGSSACLVNPQNPKEIADSINYLMNNKDVKKKLVRQGFENIKRFSWEKCAKQTLKVIYESCYCS